MFVGGKLEDLHANVRSCADDSFSPTHCCAPWYRPLSDDGSDDPFMLTASCRPPLSPGWHRYWEAVLASQAGLRQSAALKFRRQWREYGGKPQSKVRPECEKWFEKEEEKAEAFRCDNYAGLLGTGRWVLLAPICVPSVPAPSPSTNQNYSLFAFSLIYAQAWSRDGVCD